MLQLPEKRWIQSSTDAIGIDVPRNWRSVGFHLRSMLPRSGRSDHCSENQGSSDALLRWLPHNLSTDSIGFCAEHSGASEYGDIAISGVVFTGARMAAAVHSASSRRLCSGNHLGTLQAGLQSCSAAQLYPVHLPPAVHMQPCHGIRSSHPRLRGHRPFKAFALSQSGSLRCDWRHPWGSTTLAAERDMASRHQTEESQRVCCLCWSLDRVRAEIFWSSRD